MHAIVGIKLKVGWKPQEAGDTRNMDCLPKKAAGHEQRQPKGEAMWGATSKAIGLELPSLLEPNSHHHLLQMPDMHLQYLMFSLMDFSLTLVKLFSIFPILLLEWKYLHSDTVSWDYITCFLFLQGFIAKSLP